ncbi:polysaccharide pyruvyl transferase family protein (plasmid) [Aminobacter sp. SR38]|jgi:hypothetical protein|uniref:polysaccharide pyruvyl transferase family protein n=1 Tax=Aminobacter sp. SR38 TaxID=2774562 RepID=UPI00177BEE49|nr:polysaccharide pyruvyl transferase family protein [Aminobacter sp. SR38]QOF74608.1 polysaccharide pyruvyl transferase family protein [Aminobacter sp. SR38]
MKVLFLGAPIAPHSDTSLSWREKFQYFGHNTGNLLIGQSLREEISVSDFHFGHGINPKEASERFDMILIPAANFLFKNFDFGYLADFVEATTLPCMMVGLGAQAPTVDSARIEGIPAGTMHLLQLVADRSKVIGVRGDFTAQVLNDLGYKNVEPLGCPSLYRTLKRELKVKRSHVASDLKLSLNGSSNVVQHSVSVEAAKMVESALLRLSLEKGFNYVLQNETPEMTVQHNADPTTDDLATLGVLVKRFDLGLSPQEYAAHIRTRFRTFFDLNSWDAYIKTVDASIGSRFHGNLISLTNGVPAFVVTHDSRTTEMAELMRIPHRRVDQIDRFDVNDLFMSADFDAFETRYTRLYDRYAAFLTKNGVHHKLEHPPVDTTRRSLDGIC